MNKILNKSELVVDYIKKKIIDNDWKEDDKIPSEALLCKELNVSRVSVRAAIDRLIASDMLYKSESGRTYVKKVNASSYFSNLNSFLTLNNSDWKEVLQFRMIIEVPSVKLFIENCSNEDILELEEIYKRMVKNSSNIKFYFYDFEFHKIIARGTKNSILIKIYDLLFSLLDNHQNFLFNSLGPESGIKDHKEILDAIKRKDSELATLFMKRHLERTLKDLESL